MSIPLKWKYNFLNCCSITVAPIFPITPPCPTHPTPSTFNSPPQPTVVLTKFKNKECQNQCRPHKSRIAWALELVGLFEFWPCPSLTIWPWVSYLTSLCLSSLIVITQKRSLGLNEILCWTVEQECQLKCKHSLCVYCHCTSDLQLSLPSRFFSL